MAPLSKIPPKIWFFGFALILFVTSVARLPYAGAETQEADITRYSRDNAGLHEAIVRYHNDMNELFNENIEKLLAKSPDDPDVIPPNIAEGETCASENVSTYCVAMQAVDKYDAFRNALLTTHLPYYIDKTTDDLEDINSDRRDAVVIDRIDNAISDYSARTDTIMDQIEIAEQAMDATLSAYNEIYLYYQLHLEYDILIKDLEDYRDELAKLRRTVEIYPSKFHNRTTTSCT